MFIIRRNKEEDRTHLPNTQELDEEVTRESTCEHLTDDEHVGGQRALQHDRHITRVEQLDRVAPPLSSEPVALHRDLNPEALQVNDGQENHDSRDEVHDIRQSFPPKCFT